jgi:DNA-binding PadR family transcriptional regulator
MTKSDGKMLNSTLDVMLLCTLVTGDAHGHTIAKVIEQSSEDVLDQEQGSLYRALHRLEDRRWCRRIEVQAKTIATQCSTNLLQQGEIS